MNSPWSLQALRVRPAAAQMYSSGSKVWVLAVCVCMLMVSMIRLAPARAADLLSPPQVEQLVAPVALYPDSLLSQVLMASTYPLEVVQAQRWRAAHPGNMSDQQISPDVQDKPWDPSVKSLTAFPDVLQMMSDRIDWTQQLGDAFLGQQQDVMDAVQRLRARAQATGHLNSGSQQAVVINRDGPPIIQIVPVNPEVIYVPVYNPLIVYGPWPYAAYRPFYWHPAAYRPAPGVFISFGAGLFVGHALWGHVDWRQRAVTINVNRYNSFNHVHIVDNRWVHSVEHRRGVEYRNPVVRQRYDQDKRSPAARDAQRQPFRNQAETGRTQLSRPADRQAAQRAVQTERLRTAPAERRGPAAHSPDSGVLDAHAPSARIPRRSEGDTDPRTNNARGRSAPQASGRPAETSGDGGRDVPQHRAAQREAKREAPRPAMQQREAPRRGAQERDTPRPAAQQRDTSRPAAQPHSEQKRSEARGPERRDNRGDRKSD